MVRAHPTVPAKSNTWLNIVGCVKVLCTRHAHMRRLFALIDRLHRNIDRTSQCSERARHQDGAEQPLASADGEKYDRGAGLTNGPLLFAGFQLRASAIGGNAWSASNSEH